MQGATEDWIKWLVLGRIVLHMNRPISVLHRNTEESVWLESLHQLMTSFKYMCVEAWSVGVSRET